MRFSITGKSVRAAALRNGASAAVIAAAFASAATVAHAADPASADQAASATPSTQLGEVVVVSRKRSENVQKVPLAVSTVNAQQLAQEGIRQATDLQRVVPSMTGGNSAINIDGGSQNDATFSLRGMGASGAELTVGYAVGLYEDTVNIPYPAGVNAMLFDLDHVEVVKGPQGTLYGRNTTGGAVNFITRGADYQGVHGYVSGEYGNYNDLKVDAAVNLPIIPDVFAARLAYEHWTRQGYGSDPVTGQHPGGDHDDDKFRLSLRFDPTSYFTATTKVEYINLNQVGYLQTLVGLEPGGGLAALEAATEFGAAHIGTGTLTPYIGNPFTTYAEQHLFDKSHSWHFAEDMTLTLPYDIKLRSITGFHAEEETDATDLDGTPYDILEPQSQPVPNPWNNPAFGPAYPHAPIPTQDYHQVSQEFDLSGHSFGRLDWLVGGFLSWEQGFGGTPDQAFGLAAPAVTPGSIYFTPVVTTTTNLTDETQDSWAIFTQNDFHILDNLSLTAGVRYTHEGLSEASQTYNWQNGFYTCYFQSLSNPSEIPAPGNNYANCYTINQSTRSNGVSYLFSLNWQVTPDILAYVKTARGFRGAALQESAAGLPAVKPEIAVDYEVGFKADFFDHRLRTNLAYYHTNYANKQEQQSTVTCGLIIVPATQTLCNGGAEGVGIPHSSIIIANAASAQIDGFEAEVRAAPVTGWTVYGTLTYLDGRYNKFDNAPTPDGTLVNGSGTRFLEPTWRYSIGSRYEHEVGPGVLGGSIDWSWRAHNNETPVNTSALFSQALQTQLNAAVGLMDARVDYRLPDDGIDVSLWATNLLDYRYQTLGLNFASLGILTGYTQPPRMFGITVTKTFGGG